MDMQQLALEEAALKALSDTISDRLKAVRADMQTALEGSGATRVTAVLPDGTKVGTISATEPKPTAQVADDAAFLDWVREHSPDNISTRLVTEVRPAYATALLAQMTAAGAPQWPNPETGELIDVPGVQIRTARTRGHSTRLSNGGREAIGEAWRSGALTHLALPLITAGGAE